MARECKPLSVIVRCRE